MKKEDDALDFMQNEELEINWDMQEHEYPTPKADTTLRDSTTEKSIIEEASLKWINW